MRLAGPGQGPFHSPAILFSYFFFIYLKCDEDHLQRILTLRFKLAL